MQRSGSRNRSILKSGLIALAAVAGATILRLLFAPILGYHIPLVTYPLAVLVAGYFGGMGAGLLATAMGILVAEYFFMAPAYSLKWSGPADAVGLGLFAIVGVCTSLICEAHRRARHCAEESVEALRISEASLRQAHDQLERRVEARTIELTRANVNLQLEIADRGQAEEAIRISEERLRRAQEIAQLGSWELDLVQGRLVWSDEVYRIFGLQPQEFDATYEAFLERVHPDDRAAVDAAYSSSLCEGRDTYEIEHRIVRKCTGEIRFVHEKCEHFRDATGRIIRSMGMVHDITERKLAEAALQESEANLKAAQRIARIGSWQWDVVTDTASWSDETYSMFGLVPSQLAKHRKNFLDLIHPDDKDRVGQALQDALAGTKEYDLEYRILLDDRTEKAIHARAEVMRAADGRPLMMRGTVHDITERKQVEQALRESEARLRTALDNAPFDIWIRDQEGLCIMENAATLEHWGPLLAKRPEETDIPEAVLRTWQENNRRAFAGEVVLGEVEYFHQGQRRVYYNIIAPIRVGGEIHGILGFNLDITERKRVEEALRSANEALAEADRRKDEFLAMLAHELRNPLAPVRNAVEVLRMIGPREPALQRQRDVIDRQINHMARLIDDLLDVSRITRGRIELKKQPLHLAEVLAQAVELAVPLIETRRQEFSLALPPDDLCVEADPDRLAQAIGNLLANAAKYTENGGRIWLEARREGEDAVIVVRDTGVGIAPEMLPRIFELFAQADQGLARSQGGLGIGLTMARQLVEMHGGTLEAHSEGLGQGSEFVIHLPAHLETDRAPESYLKGASEIPESPPCRILVVDDLADTADSLTEMLTLAGHEARAAYNGPAALNLISVFLPDVVLLDIGMPEMDGYEVARRMRLEEAGKKALLVALTGYAQECDREMARQAGFDRYLTKPVKLELLRELLAQPLVQPESSAF